MPKTRASFWRQKLEANVGRDAAAQTALTEAGWTSLVVWECEVGPETLEQLCNRIRSVPTMRKRQRKIDHFSCQRMDAPAETDTSTLRFD